MPLRGEFLAELVEGEGDADDLHALVGGMQAGIDYLLHGHLADGPLDQFLARSRVDAQSNPSFLEHRRGKSHVDVNLLGFSLGGRAANDDLLGDRHHVAGNAGFGVDVFRQGVEKLKGPGLVLVRGREESLDQRKLLLLGGLIGGLQSLVVRSAGNGWFRFAHAFLVPVSPRRVQLLRALATMARRRARKAASRRSARWRVEVAVACLGTACGD